MTRSFPHGGEESLIVGSPRPAAKTLCTQIHKGTFSGKSCSKTLIAHVYRKENAVDRLTLNIIIDNQSNK